MKGYRWNARKCAKNLAGIFLRLSIVAIFFLLAGFNPMHII